MRHVLEYLEQSATRFPDKVAFADQNNQITFSELQDRAKGLGTLLQERICKRNTPIGAVIDRGIDGIIAMMGILYSGNYYVPVDATLPPQRAKQIEEYIEGLVYGAPHLTFAEGFEVDRFCLDEGENHPVNTDLLDKVREKTLDVDPAYLLFTSGSTGTPKGIVISHQSVIDFADWFGEFSGCNSDDIFANQAPFYFDASLRDLYQTLKQGATCHILPKKYFSFPKLLVEALEEKRITALHWVTFAFQWLANSGGLKIADLSRIRMVTLGGDLLQGKYVNIWKEELPQLEIYNVYGPTETTVDCTGFHINRHFEDHETIPIGKACRNKEIILLDEGLNLVAKGEKGELCVRGCGLSKGYFDDPEKTKNAFIQNPLQPHYTDLIYRTGDLAYENSMGEFVFVSRFDGQIKHMGYRIELADIETAIHSLPEIREVVCLFDPIEDSILCIYVGEMDKTAIIKGLRTRLPKYMHPNIYHLRDSLPINPNGKVDRVALKEEYL